MSFGRNYQQQGGTMYENRWPETLKSHNSYDYSNLNSYRYNGYVDYSGSRDRNIVDYQFNATRNCKEEGGNYPSRPAAPAQSLKRRKYTENAWGNDVGFYWQPNEGGSGSGMSIQLNYNSLVSVAAVPSGSGNCQTVGSKRDRSVFDGDDDVAELMSKEQIERCSPSRKDGINASQETRLRYSYCSFIQNLGLRLTLPQPTIGTAMVLCHRFFIRRSHACHDRFLIATAALFLAAKYEESARPLNDFVKGSAEIIHKQDLSILSYMLPIDWFEQYRERITEAEQLILTTLNFELSVQHPYDSLTSLLHKLGLSQTMLVNLALSLVSEGFRSSLWLQFKPNQIAAGVAYLAGKMLNMNLDSYMSIWREYQTPPTVLHEVAQQLMELF